MTDVRFGSKADICSATADVRFTLNSDRESGFPQKAMSALPPKADMCGAVAHVSANSGHSDISFEYLIGKRDECWRDFEAKSLSGLKIEHEFELGRPQDR